jgi:N-acetylmuramoyl-L-alanine amidase
MDNKNAIVKKIIFLFIIPVFYSCIHQPYSSTNKLYKKQAKEFAKILREKPADTLLPAPFWVGTTNFNMRKPNFVIIHHTAQNSCEQTLKTFTTIHSQVSAHYVICKDGTIHHMLNDYLRAWHGGIARWGSVTDINSSSIGIELDNNGYETFTQPQINSLLLLLTSLKKKYGIPASNFIGHEDIAPTRKNDPNVNFPWKDLAQNGFGLWYDTTGIIVPEQFDALQALRVVGYNIKDSTAAIKAFKRHFLQANNDSILTDNDKKALINLSERLNN